MKQKIKECIIILIMAICGIAIVLYTAPIVSGTNSDPVATISEDYIPSEPSLNEEVIVLDIIKVERVEPTTYEEAFTLLTETQNKQATAQSIYDGFITLGYTEDHPAVNMIITLLNQLKEDCIYYEEIYQTLKWQKRAEEYPNATYIWLYMKNNFGWNDVVCAGVMGNIMGEIGRDMKFEKWNHKIPYGMFQWLGGRRQDIHRIYGKEPTIDEQLEFMYDELYGTDGVRRQVTAKQREKILNGKTPEEVAMAFCKYYERPGGSGTCRKAYARRAYEYFTQ